MKWYVNIIKLIWTNIQIYWNAQELTKQISKYIWMPKIWPNDFPNIFIHPRPDGKIIQIYLDAKDLTKQIFEFIGTKESPHIPIYLYFASQCFRVLIIQICLSLLKQVKTVSNWSYIDKIGPECPANGKQNTWKRFKKYLNLFECPRIAQTNIQIYLDAKKLEK